MFRLRGVLFLVLGLVLADGVTRSAEDGAEARRIPRLIERLGSPVFKEREQASSALEALGEDAVEALREALDSQQDPEIRRRVRRLLAVLNFQSPDSPAFAEQLMEFLGVFQESCLWEPKQETCARAIVQALFERARCKVPADLRRRLDRARDMSHADLQALFRDAHVRSVRRSKETLKSLTELAIRRVMAKVDPYAELITEENLARWNCDVVSRPAGVGLRLAVDSASGFIRVITPERGGPAHQAGVRAGDLLTEITLTTDSDGRPLDPPRVLSTGGMSAGLVLEKIRGRNGTWVKLTLLRDGVAKPLYLKMKRGPFSPDTVRGYRLKEDDTWDYWLDRRNQIAYIRLTQFGRRSHADLEETVADLRRQGMKGLILDLRFNPGGLLTSAVQISEMFIKKDATIFSVRPRVGRGKTYTNTDTDKYVDFPIVCLINGDSVSGAEIVSGCFQDHHRALIVGERSHGKGCVQNIQPFGRGELKITIAMFVRPSGKKLERKPVPGFPDDDWGVTPDRGYVLVLSDRERARLKEYLDSRDHIVRRDRPVRDAFATFADRQRDLALTYLRDRIRKIQG